MSELNLIETTVSEAAIRLRYADAADTEKATSWIDIRVPVESLRYDASGGNGPLGDLDLQFLSEIRLAALRRVRAVVGDEIQRLVALAGRRP